MAKSKTKRAKAQQVRVPRRAVAIRPTVRMDGAAAKYAALLADPCNGDLVAGPFGDGNGGLVCRFEKEYIINNSSTDTCSAFVFNPSSGLVAWQTNPIVTDTDALTLFPAAVSSVHPGHTFLAANASWFRPLAACLQVYYPGSELSRAGVVSLGRYAAEVVNDTTATVSQLRTQANYVARTPADMAEIVWRPVEFDLVGREPIPAASISTNGMANAQTTSLVATGAGLPVSTGLRYRVVVVYEWQPDPASGFKNNVVRSPNPVRLGDILAKLDATGDWMAGTAKGAGRAISSLAHGVASMFQLGNGAMRVGRALLG